MSKKATGATASPAVAGKPLSLKLLVDNRSRRVLFAEARKEAIDFVFGLLALPVGFVARLLSEKGMPGCIGNVYGSLERMDDSYLLRPHAKALLLKPVISSPQASQLNTLLLENEASSTTAKRFYACVGGQYYNNGSYVQCSSNYFSHDSSAICRGCNRPMTREITCVEPRAEQGGEDGGKGFVKGVVTYMLMDDLTVMPVSTISSITLLNKFDVKDLSSLEERVVNLGMDEGLELLRASLRSKTALTDVFVSTATEKDKWSAHVTATVT